MNPTADTINSMPGIDHQTVGQIVKTRLPFYESITKEITCSNKQGQYKTIRVWRREEYLPKSADPAVLEIIRRMPGDISPEDIVKKLTRLDRIAAIEYTGMHGNGAVIYLEW